MTLDSCLNSSASRRQDERGPISVWPRVVVDRLWSQSWPADEPSLRWVRGPRSMAHTVNRSPATLGATLRRDPAAATQIIMRSSTARSCSRRWAARSRKHGACRRNRKRSASFSADSDASRLKSYERHLRKAGFSVSTADGGVACIRRLANLPLTSSCSIQNCFGAGPTAFSR